MVDPDYAIAVWNDLIGAAPVPDSQKARELLLRVQGRARTAGMPAPSFEAAFASREDVVMAEIPANLPADDVLPDNLHDLLAMFH